MYSLAVAVFYGRGFPLEAIIEQIEDLNPVRGRMELVNTDLPVQAVYRLCTYTECY
ncbi:hypothetical protein UACE39S_05578 [Ureibacillus acetophenoni]